MESVSPHFAAADRIGGRNCTARHVGREERITMLIVAS